MTTTKSNPNRWFFLGTVLLLMGGSEFAQTTFADPLGANTGMTLRMAPDATYQEGCFPPCMCPMLMEQPVLGTLKLVYVGFSTGEHSYMVEDVNWFLPGSNTAEQIIGSGKYRIGTPGPITVIQHRLELDLRVGDDAPAHFDSGWLVLSNSGGIDIPISINGMFCWDRVIRVHANPVPASDFHRYVLDAGSTFQRGCIDGLCDCAVGPQFPMRGEFALVPLQANPLFQTFAVVDVRWQAMSANSTDGVPIRGFGLYWVGGEVAVQNSLSMELRVADEEPGHYESGMVGGGLQFPLIDIVTRTHTNCVDTLLHVVASPANGGGQVCGGIAGIPCGAGEFCMLPPGHCCCDFQGICMPTGGTCPEYVDLVCGCDGITYVNPCFAEAAGQSIDYWGSCRTFCGPNGQPCANGEFCKFPLGSCGTSGDPGLCTPLPLGCPDIWNPVCGCNGITYGNECDADAAGVSVRHHGVCQDPCQPTPDGFGCTSCMSVIPEEVCRAAVLHLDIQTGAVTTSDCDCMDMSACHIVFGNASPHAEGICPPDQFCEVVRRDSDNDGIDDTFWARCMSSQVGPCCLDITDDLVRYDTCLPRTEAACEAEQGIFAGTNTGCDATQACCNVGHIGNCRNMHPVCCLASNGQPGGPGSSCGPSAECGEVCGGITGIPCDNPGEFCKLPVGQCCCDHFGMCTPIMHNCPTTWDPVCGCDGLTYSNECEADAAGVSIDHRGPCGQPNCPATRVLSEPAGGHCAGLTSHVRILLNPPNSTFAIAVEDSPPAGWAVSNISHAGHYDAVNHKVKWGPFFTPFPSELSYDTSPTNDASIPQCFSGTISVDGINEAICGDSCLEPCCPRMIADTPHGGCPACPVADCNSCNASICGDASIHMCEVVGYACSWLHGCHDDLAGMTRAAYIWRTGECYCWDESAGNWFPTDCSTSPANGCCPVGNRADDTQGTIPSAALLVSLANNRGSAPNSARKVLIDLDVPATAFAVALEVNVPSGWKVTNITDGGVWDAGTHKVKWGVFFDDLSRSVGFTAYGPTKGATTRNGLSSIAPSGRWTGLVSVDGINYRITAK
jgi:hypothetical protein